MTEKVLKADDIFTVTTKESTRDFFGPSTNKKENKTFNLTRKASKGFKKQIAAKDSNSPVFNEYADQTKNFHGWITKNNSLNNSNPGSKA